MNHDQGCDATPKEERRSDKGRPQSAAWVKPAVATEGNDDIPLKRLSFPSSQAAPDFSHHGDFEKTAAARTYQASGGKDLRKQE